MSIKVDIEDIIDSLENFKSRDGKIIGEESEFIKTSLAKDDKQAWVNHLVEQYLKHEPLDIPPEEYKITKQDFVKEIARREIAKMFGKG
jgi:hypothetical protein